jgi:hypothetical protein
LFDPPLSELSAFSAFRGFKSQINGNWTLIKSEKARKSMILKRKSVALRLVISSHFGFVRFVVIRTFRLFSVPKFCRSEQGIVCIFLKVWFD